MSKAVLITGASSGIGAETARLFMDKGYHVYGASRKEIIQPAQSGEYGGFMKFIRLDVTDMVSIQSAVDKITENENGIDILINCAGIGIAGAIEDVSIDELDGQLNTNLYGYIRLIQAVLPLMRRAKRGHIINVGSVAGVFAIPFQSAYSISKASVRMLTEALRLELKPFNIDVSCVEPGDTKTPFTYSRKFSDNIHRGSVYRRWFNSAIYTMMRDEQNGASPTKPARAILRCAQRPMPPVYVTVGLSYKILVFLKRLLPIKLVHWLLGKMYLNKSVPDNFTSDGSI